MYDLIIVGASFSGFACAISSAKAGLKVLVIDCKKEIGDNLRSTGILTKEAFLEISPPLELVNLIDKVNLISPSSKTLCLRPSDDYCFYTTNLKGVLEVLYKKAKSNGVFFEFGRSFRLDDINKCRFLVGADGAFSDVARKCGLGLNKNFLIGHEVHIENVGGFADDTFSCYLDTRYAKGYIAWTAPFKNVIQVGAAALQETYPNLKGFLHKLGLSNQKIIEKRSGLIPIGGLIKDIHKDNVMLIGDAVGLVSPLSAGGIYPALVFGEKAGKLIAGYLSGAPHPADILKRSFPNFFLKKAIRKVFNKTPNLGFDLMFHLPGFNKIAKRIFFSPRRYKD